VIPRFTVTTNGHCNNVDDLSACVTVARSDEAKGGDEQMEDDHNELSLGSVAEELPEMAEPPQNPGELNTQVSRVSILILS